MSAALGYDGRGHAVLATDPLGRFTSVDPLRDGGGGANLYRYAGNSPTAATDPNGTTDPISAIGAVIKTTFNNRPRPREPVPTDPEPTNPEPVKPWYAGVDVVAFGAAAAAGLYYLGTRLTPQGRVLAAGVALSPFPAECAYAVTPDNFGPAALAYLNGSKRIVPHIHSE